MCGGGGRSLDGKAGAAAGATRPGASRPPRRTVRLGVTVLACVGLVPSGSAAAQARAPADRDSAPVAEAAAVGEAPRLDGRLDEPVWTEASPITEFVQTRPAPGEAPSRSSEVRLLLAGESLWVGFRAWDDASGIVGQVTRRDAPSFSDRVHVVLDSFRDRRTAFHFAVNPRGVKWDLYRFADTRQDAGWDPVWDVATAVDDEGWTAEFRIPLSQLRFDGGEEQRWGVDFYREIARLNEVVHWAPVPADSSAFVSRFGTLQVPGELDAPAGVEVLPYTVLGLARGEGPADGATVAVGGDAKLGLAGGLTLDLTVNPDFGQVEADPGQVNLSTLELFLPEKRPFFLEGVGVFQMPLAPWEGTPEQLFYSRRLGRAPSGSPSTDGGELEMPRVTTLLGAGKLSGRTAGGWAVGALAAVTGREEAREHRNGEPDVPHLVEPRAGYGILRLRREAEGGGSALGMMATGVRRAADGADELELPRTALTGAVDLRHRFGGEHHRIEARLAGSRVAGSEAAIARLQRSPVHGYGRPDATHVRYDPSRARLDGWNAVARLEKFSGGPLRWEASWTHRSPGFDANDLGFTPLAGFRQYNLGVRWQESRPGRWHQSWSAGAWAWGRQELGGRWLWRGTSADASLTLPGFWTLTGSLQRTDRTGSVTLLRGGPYLRLEPVWWRNVGLQSDARSPVQVSLFASHMTRDASVTRMWDVSPTISWRPSGRASLSLGARWADNRDRNAWVGSVAGEGDERRFVLGRLRQSTVSATLRAALAFSPRLSLDLYAEPFLSSGRYDRFLEVVDPDAPSYDARLNPLSEARVSGDHVLLEGAEDGPSVGRPDFDLRQLRSNVVLRWEYRPGSTLYAVWTHGRDAPGQEGTLGLSDGLDRLLDAPARDRLLLKATFWIGR